MAWTDEKSFPDFFFLRLICWCFFLDLCAPVSYSFFHSRIRPLSVSPLLFLSFATLSLFPRAQCSRFLSVFFQSLSVGARTLQVVLARETLTSSGAIALRRKFPAISAESLTSGENGSCKRKQFGVFGLCLCVSLSLTCCTGAVSGG